MESEAVITLSIVEVINYVVGAVMLFLIPYLVWVHRQLGAQKDLIVNNKEAIAVNTANDEVISEAVKDIKSMISDLQKEIHGLALIVKK